MEIRKPEMFNLAEKGGERKLLKQILIFILVYVIASIVGSIPSMIVVAIEMQAAINNGVDLNSVVMQSDELQFMYATLFGTLLSSIVVILWCRLIEKRSLRSIGFKRGNVLRHYAIGMIIAFAMFSLVVGINLVTGAMTIESVVANLDHTALLCILLFFIGYIFQGAYEEILTRGYLMVNVGAKYKTVTALTISAVVFALLHGGNPGISIVAVINLALIAVFFGLYIICFDNIWGACAMHSVWNFVQGNFYGIKVSGLNVFESIFVTRSIPGKELINGGNFGAEGGIATTIAVALSIGILLMYMKKKGKIEKNTANETSK